MAKDSHTPGNSKTLAARLRIALEGDMMPVRDAARAFVSRPSMAPIPADTPTDIHREKTLDRLKQMIAEGYTRLPYSKATGGEGKRREYMNTVEIIAHHDLSLAVKQGVQVGLLGMSLENIGTAKHHKKYLVPAMSGKLFGGFAMTEVSGGSDVQGLATEAVYDHATRSFTIHTPNAAARKAYIGNAALHGEVMLVFAQLKMTPGGESLGVHAFMVPIRDKQGKTMPGVTIEDCGHKVGLNGVDNGYLAFDHVKVPYDDMLDRFAQIDADGNYQSEYPKKTQRFFKMIGTLVTGRVFVSMATLSGAKNALTTSVNFAENRKVFGETLMDKQATQSRLLPSLAHTYAMHFTTRFLIDEFLNGNDNLETMAAALKAKSSDAAIEIVDEGRRLAGGSGYMSEERYGVLRDDLDIFRTFEGDNTVLRLLVARNQMTRLAQKFSDAGGVEKMRAAASMKLADTFSGFGMQSGKTNAAHFCDPAFQLKIFSRREKFMMYALSSKFMEINKKEGADVAANKCQDEMIAYADAYAEHLMMQEFIRAVEAQKDPEVKAVLKDVCDLFAVHTLRKNGLWHVENGLMKPKATAALQKLEWELQEKIRPHAKALTEAFGIPAISLAGTPVAKPQAPKSQDKPGPL